MVQLHYCQNHSVCISVPQSPKSWQQTDRTNTGRGYTLQKPHVQLFCNQTKLSLCVWENVSLSEHDLIVFPDCEAERGRVCVFIVVFHHNLKWAFIVLGLHFRNHPFSNSDGWCQEIWGALSHFFPQCKFQMEVMQIFLARMLLISLLQKFTLLHPMVIFTHWPLYLLLAPRFAFRGALILHGTDSILLRPEASIGDFHPENWPQLMFVHFQTILCKPY